MQWRVRRRRDLASTARVVLSNEVAVIQVTALTEKSAEPILAAKPAAVVNLAKFATATEPTQGLLSLLNSGILVFEVELPANLELNDRSQLSWDGKTLSLGSQELNFKLLDLAEVAGAAVNANKQIITRLAAVDLASAFAENREQMIEGAGFPTLDGSLKNRPVIILNPTTTATEFKKLIPYISAQSPVIIAVENWYAAESNRYLPNLIVTQSVTPVPDKIEHIVVPTQDINSSDYALLLAHHLQASYQIITGKSNQFAGLQSLTDRQLANRFIIQNQLGSEIVTADIANKLQQGKLSVGSLWLVFGAAAAALLVAIATTPIGNSWAAAVLSWWK